ncbi:B12-binding domain-containing radical SAM protein [Clavibacter michiganensis]|uniref:Radical SAM protein n=1 Tax=Clavibacter michiganensis subsp. insidiosus TaxID=33014 RepID=A0A0D5CG78_9MICO|nr:B12-binding domain-containing radical SAM protein [Clavibacter michiganensis]AJW78300.1 radical SAM protein [Clavibacter michiganensis subsp. insidiosus]AWF99284.1 B12-binding domain-containing radical SAM protein [Clavibacter michiganensis subsp. insidiosus]AWG00601.1 B12-binding domain-containing radical SAM protein [Clavibacter michiganensis subsp. insidiosus]OQJ60788.1 B12-binding domain-containing radical SAM protein [Clavibacter michiganensis subsp. insidiosus]RII87209.1 B12-binding d
MTHVMFTIVEDEFARDFLQHPLDALIAASVLARDGHDVAIWDQRVADAPPTAPDPAYVVVVTAIADRAQCYPLDLGPVRRSVEGIRDRWPGARVIAVGPHGTQLPQPTLEDLGVDYVARGEADAAAVGAVGLLEEGGIPLSRVLPASGRFAPLEPERLPVPDYDLIDAGAYTAETFTDGSLHRSTCGIVLGVRGCTYGCSFCHLPFGTRMRAEPVETTLATIEQQTSRGVSDIFFLDYVFGLHRSFYTDLCRELTGRGVSWTGQTRTEVVLRTDVGDWAEAGCRGMWLGAESPAVSETGVGKRIPAEKIQQAIEKLSHAGITPFAFVLLGLPDDPTCRSGEIVDWAATIPGYFGLNQLFLRPGTPLYDEIAARYSPDGPPRDWYGVDRITQRYREEYPADLDDLERRLQALPNYIGNALY